MNVKKYSENFKKIKEENNYKVIADKIITILKSIKNDPNISSRRWVWELMQNATDVKYEKEKISVKFILDEDKLVFKHNGKYFRINDILSLLQQVSSKNSQNLEGQTGKFGTGFIGTHLLSDVIDVKGILLLNDNDFGEFKLSLDRSEQISEKLAKNIKKSIEFFEKIEENSNNFTLKPNYLKNRKENDFDTSFTYYLNDEEKKESAINGLNDLINTMPITLITQNQKIKQVTIIDNIKKIKTIYIPKLEGKEKENDITQSSVKVIFINNKNNEGSIEYNYISYLKVDKKKEILRLITEVTKKDGEISISKKNLNNPVLFRNFPLIGTNKFNMPFIVDGFDFYPLESRSGILLNGGRNEKNSETQKNMMLINEAYDASIDFIKCMLEKYPYLKHRFYLASSKLPKPIFTFDSYAQSWIEERQKLFRQKLKDLPLVNFENIYYNLSELLLPIFNEKYNKEFYNVVSILNIRKKILPQKEYYIEWYNIIVEENNEVQGINIKNNPQIKSWGMTKKEENGEIEMNYIYDEIDLLKDLKNCKNISTLSDKLNKNIEDTINSLNIFLQFLKKNCKYDEILNKYPIIPNRNGDFKKIENLYSDDENIIPKEVMDIYDSISKNKLKDILIDSRINIEYLGDLLKKKKLDSISEDLNNYILKNKDTEETKQLVVYPLLSIKSDIKQVSRIYEFLTFFYNLEEKNILNNNNKTTIPIYFWTMALKFWFNEHPKEIEKYQNIMGLRNKLINKNIDNIAILKWMNNYLDFLKLNSQDRYFENLKIFPNQNGDFCALHSLYSDSGFPEEFKDILKNRFNIDKRKILLDKQILTYKENKIMHEIEITKEIKSEFIKLKEENNDKLEDIAFDILCLYPENKEKEKIRKYLETIIVPNRTDKELESNPIDYLGFAEVTYNKKDKFVIKHINTETLDYMVFINYIIEKICDKIEKAGDFKNIKDNFYGIETINNLENLIIKLVKFIWDSQNSDYPIKSCIDFDTSKKKYF